MISPTKKQKKPAESVAPAIKTATRQSEVTHDQSEVVSSLRTAYRHYKEVTSPRETLIDMFILYLVSLIGCLVFYRVVIGDDFPRNAFLTGIFSPLGVIMLLVAIRKQEKDYRQLAEYLLAVEVLFIVAFNFLG